MSREMLWLLAGGAAIVLGGGYLVHAHNAAAAAAQAQQDQSGPAGSPPLFLPSGSSGGSLDGVSPGLGASQPAGVPTTNPSAPPGTTPAAGSDLTALLSTLGTISLHNTDTTAATSLQLGNLQALVSGITSGGNVSGNVGNTAGGTNITVTHTDNPTPVDPALKYLADNPDVGAAFARQQAGGPVMYADAHTPQEFAIDHFLQYGSIEGRENPITGAPGTGTPAATR